MRLFVIRHGETEYNAKRIFTGWSDVPLTEKGRKDAESISEFLSRFNFDKVYSSDLRRAYETAKIALPDYEVEKCALVREFSVGSLENQPIDDSAEILAAIHAHDYTPFGGENIEMMSERLKKFLSLLENSDYNNVAVFAHGGVLMTTLELVIGEHNTSAVRRPNCGIAVYDYKDGKWVLTSWIDPVLLNSTDNNVSVENDKF